MTPMYSISRIRGVSGGSGDVTELAPAGKLQCARMQHYATYAMPKPKAQNTRKMVLTTPRLCITGSVAKR